MSVAKQDEPSPSANHVDGGFGDPRAGAAVRLAMEQHDRRLRRYIAQLIGVQDAEDAVQELYARLLHVARDGRHPMFGIAYLRRTAESVALDLLRRRRARMEKAHVELEPTVASAQPDPFDYARGRQNIAHLKQAIMALPRLQRRILLMHRLDDMSLQEISAELGIPLRTVQRHTMEALATCRQHLQRLGWFDAE